MAFLLEYKVNVINFFRSLSLVLATLIVVGCASQSPNQTGYEDVSNAAIEYHQQQVQLIRNWQVQGRIAFFDDVNQDRSAANLTWQSTLVTPTSSVFRLYHPLQGTLARLTVQQDMSTLELEDESYTAENVDYLLSYYLNLPLPYTLVQNAMTSLIPNSSDIQAVKYYEDGTPWSYTYRNSDVYQEWFVEFNHYRAYPLLVDNEEQWVQLPTSIELTGAGTRIKLQIQRWDITSE
ncbi:MULTISPECIES: lipoprotein insertase outer membrane protein LolB [Gammaproteobacteria]|uniref:lipoprotein insertase outer membrane protein LolB n=1 Tax=Gammaproteobacteria TaxID=1236 RepID=UPI000DD058E4|nr:MULTISPECIES: lipoprotein insertase outer membrane protein LolB [Gammaproteobacteria]RTE87426.1 outer membrane lipoprotein LolB [Aliidiomarina sp. B3213]TCZ92789.1 outer membrane lipoprotein LolB [Lysobacter sp. N42]